MNNNNRFIDDKGLSESISLISNPSKNHDTFIKLLQDVKDKHLLVRKIKFNKYKHSKNK